MSKLSLCTVVHDIDIGRVVLRLSVADGETVTDTSKSDANKLVMA